MLIVTCSICTFLAQTSDSIKPVLLYTLLINEKRFSLFINSTVTEFFANNYTHYCLGQSKCYNFHQTCPTTQDCSGVSSFTMCIVFESATVLPLPLFLHILPSSTLPGFSRALKCLQAMTLFLLILS